MFKTGDIVKFKDHLPLIPKHFEGRSLKVIHVVDNLVCIESPDGRRGWTAFSCLCFSKPYKVFKYYRG